MKHMMKRTPCLVKHGGDGSLVMLWGYFASSGTGNLQGVEGKMDLLKYQEIYWRKQHDISEEAEA